MKKVLYRYLRSHWMETLRNCEFMVSRPSKFRKMESDNSDPLDCLPQLNGVVSRNILERGLPQNLDKNQVSPCFPEKFTANFNDFFRKDEAMDSVLRVLCLSDASDNNTDMHMWKNYANDFAGVRIGIGLNLGDELETNFGGYMGRWVEYCDNPNLIIAKTLSHPRELSDWNWDIIFKKAKKFAVEKEYRIVTASNLWVSRAGGEYVRLLNENIISVDVGCLVPLKERKKLMKFCRKNFNLVRMSVAQPNQSGNVEYSVEGANKVLT